MELEKIKSTIAVHSKYHALRLAEGLNNENFLDKVYTTYPKFKLTSYKVPSSKIKSFWFLGAVKYINSHYGNLFSDNFITSFFDNWVSAILKKPGDKWVFTGYSGFCEKSLKKAKKMGAVTLVERACPHIDEQEELIRQEKSLLLNKKIDITSNEVYERMKREYDLADFISVPSEYTKKSFIKRGISPSKIIKVPLCNEKDVPFRKIPVKYPEVFTVFCVSGNFYRKGLIYLLRAWKELGLQNAKLIVKGEIPNEFIEYKKIPNLEIISHHISDDDLIKLYEKSSICILPSIDDGFGMVVIEAMRAALPVIVTQNVGASEVLEDGKEGFIIPIRDTEALKEKILYFYNHPDKVNSMGLNALEKAKQYTPEEYAKRMIVEYNKLF